MSKSAWLASLAAVAVTAGIAWLPASAQRGGEDARRSEARVSENVDPRARQIVERMGDFLGRQQSFQVTADSITEVVLQNGMRLQLAASSDVKVRRPDGLRSERRGPMSEVTLVYDGDRMHLVVPRSNVYASADAPDTLDDAIDFARERLDLEAPGADLLYSEPGEGLMEGVQSGMYVGEAEIDGKRAHHVAFREREVDWQLWVQDGEEALPLRYVIVSRRVRSQPQFAVELRDWDLTTEIDPADFTFTPPEGAREIPFAGLPERERSAERGGE